MSFNQSDYNKRALIKGTVEIYAAFGVNTAAAALAAGKVHLGDVGDFSFKPEAEITEKDGSRRGKKVLVKSAVTRVALAYMAKLSEANLTNAGLLVNADPDYDFGSDPANNAQSAISAAAGTAWDFDEGSDGTANTVGRYYRVLNSSGAHVTDLTALTLAGTESAYGAASDSTSLLLGTDYEVDLKLGLVKFLVSIADDVITPTITCPAITSASTQYMTARKPNSAGFLEGIFDIYVWDEDDDSQLVFSHTDFLGRISVSEEMAVGDDWSEIGTEVKVLADTGTFYVRTNAT